ncbi:hypothetical protein BDZ89DRAFT_958424 [Hymenopellis radicata]|nr:hypothetical protein BDZ89DRAFT_970674 [Hymenopellis radicata]KAF9020401.1 hypothetical protein BDZ89DRAFT_958424 [Hymenopellis radicata]
MQDIQFPVFSLPLPCWCVLIVFLIIYLPCDRFWRHPPSHLRSQVTIFIQVCRELGEFACDGEVITKRLCTPSSLPCLLYDWKPALVSLKNSFWDFQRDILLAHHYCFHRSTEQVLLVARLSYTPYGPILKALTLGLNPSVPQTVMQLAAPLMDTFPSVQPIWLFLK